MKTVLKHLWLFIVIVIAPITTLIAQKQYVLKSPNAEIEVKISINKTISYSINHLQDVVIETSPISMQLTSGSSFGINPKITSSTTRSMNQKIEATIYKKKTIVDCFNELTLNFKNDYTVIFRAYDDGVAYRFVSTSKKPFEVKEEQAEFNFPSNSKMFTAYVNKNNPKSFEEQFFNSFENIYVHQDLTDWEKGRLAFCPLVVQEINGKKVCLLEADLLNYPGMYLYNKDGSNTLNGIFAPYPKDIELGGYNMLQGVVKSREPFIAKFDGATNFPWRVIVIAQKDHELANSDMVYKLATAAQQTDYSWVKPGKVAWDWWNDWNIYNVDFRAGINNQTYKYYIDFASANGIEYVILDEGWAVNLKADLMQVVPEIDMKELANYAKGKNVGLILWAGYNAFNRNMEEVCKHYSEMGVKGFKIDFMDRDDQQMVDFHHRAAQIAAKYKILLDFHGTYKPTGLQRTYPNVINFEGVYGLEQLKWNPSTHDQVTYDVTMPFIRMVAGPVDYTQGAMRNATKANYRPINSEAMSQGTRCRQLAEYVIFDSPLNMLCDNPSNYMGEKECTRFISSIPTTWDNTISLDGEIGKFIVIARQKGNDWYVGSLTNWDKRELVIDLSFLGQGSFKGEVFRDGINADRVARDYVKEVIEIPNNRKLHISMASGGGYALRIYKSN